MKNKFLIILLITYFLKELLWTAVIPIWHFPDEEQHFAQGAFFAEKNRFPVQDDFDVSQEIDKSSELLGTKRDKRGINKFTYHPEYKIPYVKGTEGLFEKEILNLNNSKNRQTMVKHEAASYGPTYYLMMAFIYRLVYQKDLFIRLFTSRFLSIILSTITILFVYFIAAEIFKKEILKLSLTFLVAFQPMFSFVSAGVNNDNLFNLLFTAFLFFSLKLIFLSKRQLLAKENIFYLVLLVLIFLGGLQTKKQMLISLPILLVGYLLSLFKRSKRTRKITLIIFLTVFLGWLLVSGGKVDVPEYNPNEPSRLGENVFQYLFWHLRHTVAETIPWYWGVFNWLGVTLPRWFNRIQSRILILSSIGFLYYLFLQVKNKKISSRENLKILFLFGAALIYYFSIISWDYFFRLGHGFSFGIQGRYFFPTIVSHMLLMFLGLVTLFPKKWEIAGIKIIQLWWIFYSLVGLYTASKAYYHLFPIKTFLDEASQYKPAIFKGLGLVIIMTSFFLCLIYYLYLIFHYHERKHYSSF
jgi:uncharacterized membrane protein